MKVDQRNVTRNQSTADYSVKKIFIFDNRYKFVQFSNPSGGGAEAVEIESGMLVVRDTTNANGVLAATSANLANVIGVAKLDGKVSVEPGSTLPIDICTKGTIDGNLLVLPATVTLNTTVGTKALTDVLESLGLHVDTSAVEHTNFDN